MEFSCDYLIDDNLPKTLKKLTLNLSSQKIEVWPPNLTHLTLGQKFKTAITTLPPTLTHFTLNSMYSEYHKLLSILPPNITHLRFGYYFNLPLVSRSLPPKLKFLKIGKNYTRTLQGIFDANKNLTHITIHKGISLPWVPDYATIHYYN